jgi:diguanylate cyclase (GGDEF)-like protein
MEVTQDVLLPVLLAAIVANTVLLLLVVYAGRMGRHKSVTPAATRSVLQGSLMSSSFVDESARSSWASDGDSNNGTAGDAGANDSGDADPGHAPVPALVGAALVEAEMPAEAPAGTSATVEPENAPTAERVAVEAKPGTDALTGLLDGAAFNRLVAAENLRIHRYHRPATVVIFELGGLDRLIDRLGAEAADRVVPALADTMRRLARDVDLVARLAPGRFGILLPETDEVAAINYVERVRRACELWLESGAIALSLAVGWAGTDGEPTLIEAQRLATERMYVELRRDARKASEG